MKETQTRLWWMEVIRGVITITFGLLFIFIDVRFFIYALGIYLIFDGTLDIYKVAAGKRTSNRKVLSSLGGTLSILLGLISLVYHVLTILFLLLLIVVRIMISGVRVIRPSRILRVPPREDSTLRLEVRLPAATL